MDGQHDHKDSPIGRIGPGSWDLAILGRSDVPSGGVTAVRIPDLGDAEDWLVRLSLPAEGASVICGTTP